MQSGAEMRDASTGFLGSGLSVFQNVMKTGCSCLEIPELPITQADSDALL